MNYSILFLLFPQDIVYYIVQIIKQIKSKNSILKHYIKTKKKLQSIKEITNIITDSNIRGISYNKFLNNEFLDKLFIIYISNYNRNKYMNEFWVIFTDLLSKKLMQFSNNILINNENKKNNKKYIILNKSINLWFKICTKHNIRLMLSFSKVEDYVYCFSRQIKEIKNFIKFIYSPRSVDSNNLFLSEEYSRFLITNITNN